MKILTPDNIYNFNLVVMMKLSKLIAELKRRNVLKSIIAYLAVAWVLVQIASILFPIFGAPGYALKAFVYLLAFGLVIWIGVSWVYELTPEGIQKTEDFDGSKEDIRFENRKLNKFIITTLIVAVGLLVAISFWAGSAWDSKANAVVSKKVAVIPFDQEIINEEDVYFQSGMTKILIDELSKVDQLTVISQTSTQVLEAGFSAGNSVALDVIRGIDYYIIGSIEKELNSVQVIVELKESIDAIPLWKKSYSGDVSEVRSLAARASDDLTRQMGLIVSREDKVLWSNLRKVKPETFELYLKAKHYLNKSTPEDWQKGIVYMKEAIDRNPADPYAYAYLAEAYINLGHLPAPQRDVFPKALAAAKRAIQLDSTVALGWAALSHYHTYFGMDWDMAEYAFKRADELNPNLADNHFHRSWYLALFGRMNEAIDAHKRAQELDPFGPLNSAWLGELYRWLEMYEEGLAETDKAEAVQQEYAIGKAVKGRIFMDQGRTDEGLELLKESSEIFQMWRYSMYAIGLYESGQIEEVKKIIRELESYPPNGYFALCLGILYSRIGDYDKAFEWLNFEQKHGWYPWIRVLFVNDEFRKDPRFLKIIRDMNLPDPSPLVYTPE